MRQIVRTAGPKLETRVELNAWQKEMLLEVLETLPPRVKEILNERVKLVEYGFERIGNGHYERENLRVTLSRGITHPRYFIELALHEIGHGFQDWLNEHGHKTPIPDVRQEYADAFALAILHPERLSEEKFREAGGAYRASVFGGEFPKIDAEQLVAKYLPAAEKALEEERKEYGAERAGAEKFLTDAFRQQSSGYLAMH